MNRKIKLLVLSFVCGLSVAMAAPEIRSITIHNGNGVATLSNSVARLNWTIDNPDSTEYKILIQIQATSGKSSGIFTKEVSLLPNSNNTGASYVVLGESNEYLIEAFLNGKPIYKDKMLSATKLAAGIKIAMLNDKFNVDGYSKVQKMKNLPYKASFVSFRTENLPEHWSAFDDYGALIMIQPDIEAMSLTQMNAILDYVKMGGILIIASPECAMEMSSTPLAALLPYKPVSCHRENNFAFIAKQLTLKTWKDTPEYDNNGYSTQKCHPSILDILPVEEAHVILGNEQNTYATVKYCGAGAVMGFTFNFFEATQSYEVFAEPLWYFLFWNAGFISPVKMVYDADRANAALQLLHGYSIPSAYKILVILGVYIVGLAVILLIAFKKKRHSLGWSIACIYGVIVTFFVMVSSTGISNSKADVSMANLHVSVWNGTHGAARNTSMLLSATDVRPNVNVPSESVFLRQQGERVTRLATGRTAPIINKTPLTLADDGNRTQLAKLSLQKFQPRTMFWLEESYTTTPQLADFPTAEIEATGLKLQDWTLPEELKESKRALILYHNKQIRTVDISGGKVTDSGSQHLLEADTTLLSVMEYLKSFDCQSPMLALVKPGAARKDMPVNLEAGEGSTSIFEYDVTLVPVHISSKGKLDVIPPDMVYWDLIHGTQLRSSYVDGEWNYIGCTGISGAVFPVVFHVSPEYAVSSPKEIRVELEMSIPGQNMTYEAFLTDLNGERIMPASQDGNVYIFNTEGKNVISPMDGNFQFAFLLKSKQAYLMNGVGRNDSWRVQALSASIINK